MTLSHLFRMWPKWPTWKVFQTQPSTCTRWTFLTLSVNFWFIYQNISVHDAQHDLDFSLSWTCNKKLDGKFCLSLNKGTLCKAWCTYCRRCADRCGTELRAAPPPPPARGRFGHVWLSTGTCGMALKVLTLNKLLLMVVLLQKQLLSILLVWMFLPNKFKLGLKCPNCNNKYYPLIIHYEWFWQNDLNWV